MRRSFLIPVLAAAMPLLAQAPPALPAGPAAQAMRYDPATETRLSGQVREVRTAARGRLARPHPPVVRLLVDTGGGKALLVVGPDAFLRERQVTYVPGDAIEFVGSRRSFKGREFILAREITRGGQTLVLRDKDGIPAWRAGGGQGGAEGELPEAF
jgi:hypothetical protein